MTPTGPTTPASTASDRTPGSGAAPPAPYARRLATQTAALLVKNLRESRRNAAASGMQLLVGCFFLVLLLILRAALQTSSNSNTSFVDYKTALWRSATARLAP